MHEVGTISGRIFDDKGAGVAGVEIELMSEAYLPGGSRRMATAFAQTEAFGMYRIVDVLPGDYYVRAYAPGNSQPGSALATREVLERLQRDTRGEAYGSTYYPSVTSVDEAQALRVNAGQELFDIDFALAVVRTHRVAGTVIESNGPVRRASPREVDEYGPNRQQVGVHRRRGRQGILRCS